jgi:hypothetical protein
VNLARNKNHDFVPLVAESLGGLGKAAIKLFAEIARSQASFRRPVGHILRRLIDISQIAVQRGNFRRLQHAVSLCSLDDPFSNLSVSREHLRAMDCAFKSKKKKKKLLTIFFNFFFLFSTTQFCKSAAFYISNSLFTLFVCLSLLISPKPRFFFLAGESGASARAFGLVKLDGADFVIDLQPRRPASE